jgi:hypothetical protein
MRLKISPPYVSQSSRKYESLNISQNYGPSRPVTGIALSLHYYSVSSEIDGEMKIRQKCGVLTF